ncbi:MAG TPA: trehalose-phosphatase, partial [Puia sp.]|nr:trehalose-phosphatase [Puia sp.]
MKELVVEQFKKAKDKLILLDYDGTLVDYQPVPQKALPSENLLLSLSKLHSSPHTDLVIITGRSYTDIDGFVGHLPIDIVAEHGGMIRENEEWRMLVQDDGHWKQEIFPVMSRFTTRCPGTFIEEKKFSLAWHYRGADPESGYAVSRELIRALDPLATPLNLKLTDGNKVLEIKHKNIDKGRGTQYLLNKHAYDFIL